MSCHWTSWEVKLTWIINSERTASTSDPPADDAVMRMATEEEEAGAEILAAKLAESALVMVINPRFELAYCALHSRGGETLIRQLAGMLESTSFCLPVTPLTRFRDAGQSQHCLRSSSSGRTHTQLQPRRKYPFERHSRRLGNDW